MKKVYTAKITFKITSYHPEAANVENLNEKLSFEDTYTLDADRFYNNAQIIDYIKQDLSTVAGGGYSTEHIKNVEFDIKRIA